MDRPQEQKPALVLATPTQHTGETAGPNARRARWHWAEPTVWTDRMLTALETGFVGDVWFRLIDKVFSPKNLLVSLEKVAKKKGAAGVDNMSIEMFEKKYDHVSAKTFGGFAAGQICSAADQTGVHSQAGQRSKATAGNSDRA